MSMESSEKNLEPEVGDIAHGEEVVDETEDEAEGESSEVTALQFNQFKSSLPVSCS